MSEAIITVDCAGCVPPVRSRIHGTTGQVLAVGWQMVKGTRGAWNCPRCIARRLPGL